VLLLRVASLARSIGRAGQDFRVPLTVSVEVDGGDLAGAVVASEEFLEC